MLPVLAALAVMLAVGSVAIWFWHNLLGWAYDSLIPWLETWNSELASLAKNALVKLDQVAVGVKRAVKQAWDRLRETLAKQIIEFRKGATGWEVVIISWLLVWLESGERQALKRETVQRIKWEEVPDDVRASHLRGAAKPSADMIKLRETELLEAAYD
ncbi:MAG TPA: hypothetical protein VKK31_15010 [Thermoanaerobaculia bacterium]|nr:hypothetical protein [Thermoanaerobaculia bacterium]